MSGTNEWINWIEDAIFKQSIVTYKFNLFRDFQEFYTSDLGKVYHATFENKRHNFKLETLSNLNDVSAKELVHELKLRRKIHNHRNIVKFYGVTLYQENQIKQYLLIMEYVNNISLKSYLSENFNKLTWKNKYDLAYQLTDALSYLHGEGIVHGDLHSGNVLVYQDKIKIADLGLSRRINEASSKTKQLLYGVIPYIDPKRFCNLQYSLNEKSDVYSVGVLLWEISSGKPPFCAYQYNFYLAIAILRKERESVIPDTPSDYSKLYTECWNLEPENRPTMHEVADILEAMVTSENQLETSVNNLNNNILPVNNLINDNITIIIDKIMVFIFEITNKGIGKRKTFKSIVLEYLKGQNINSQEIYDWLSSNYSNDVKNSNYMFLLGYFSYYGIGTNDAGDYSRAYRLFLVSEKNHLLSRYYLGICLQYGYGINKNEIEAFKLFKTLETYAMGQLKLAFLYDKGWGIERDSDIAIYWFEQAIKNGNVTAMYQLGIKYIKGNYNLEEAFELFKRSAGENYVDSIPMLGYCYDNGIGTKVDIQEAIKLYHHAANLGHKYAQYNLGYKYEVGEGIEKNIDLAIDWYKKSAEQGDLDAKTRLEQIRTSSFFI